MAIFSELFPARHRDHGRDESSEHDERMRRHRHHGGHEDHGHERDDERGERFDY